MAKYKESQKERQLRDKIERIERKKNEIQKDEIQQILKEAKVYCEQNDLSYEILRSKKSIIVLGSLIFLQPTGVTPNGLCNDLETQPYSILCVNRSGNEYTFEQTEYTNKYLRLNSWDNKEIKQDDEELMFILDDSKNWDETEYPEEELDLKVSNKIKDLLNSTDFNSK